jgi:hypothetical protein
MSTRACHWLLSWARSFQSTPSHPVSLTSILLLLSHLLLVFWVLCSLQNFLQAFFMYFSSCLCMSLPHPSHPSLCYHHHNIWWRVQIMKLLIMQCSLTPLSLHPLAPDILLYICSITPWAYVPPIMWETNFHTHVKAGNIIVLYILIFTSSDSRQETILNYMVGSIPHT